MAFNGSGVFVRLYNWVNDAAANIKIRADRMDAEMDGMATGLSTCITKDGQTTVTANLPMATFKHTGVGDASATTQYASAGQVQKGSINWVDGGGTADAITANYSIAYASLTDGMICYVRATAANATTTPTFAPSGLTARTIVKNGGVALVAGDIAGDGHELILRYDLSNTRWELLNPAVALGSALTDLKTSYVPASASGGASLALFEDTDNGTNKVTLKAPASIASDFTLTLPSDDGNASEFLQTDGSGNLDFVALPTASDSQAGVLELLTDAEFLTGTDSSRAVLVSNFTKSIAEDGYIKLPGGLILQWGTETSPGNPTAVTFPVAFASAFYVSFATASEALARGFYIQSPSTTGMNVHQFNTGTGAATSDCNFYWFALGT